MNWIRYAPTADGGATYTNGPGVQIADSSITGVVHPTLSVTSIVTCSDMPNPNSKDEAVYVAWPDSESRCTGDAGSGTETKKWHFAVYDTVTNLWYPGATTSPTTTDWTIDVDTSFPTCIGSPITTSNPRGNINSPFVSVVTSAIPNEVLFAYIRSGASGLGTRVQTRYFSLQCDHNHGFNAVAGPAYQAPDPCYRVGGGCAGGDSGVGNGVDGGKVIADEWGVAAAYTVKLPSTQELVLTWYDTRNDPLYTNNKVQIYGSSVHSLLADWRSAIIPVSVGVGTIPWDHTLADWWDYQSIGVDTVGGSNTFLGTWGGDARNNSGQTIWSARLTP